MTINNTNPEIFYGDGNGGAANQVETGQSSERTHPWDCDEICEGCEKENNPLWCLLATAQIMKQILEHL